MRTFRLLAAAAALTAAASAQALSFNLSFIPGTSVQEQNSFRAAAAMWSAVLRDKVTVNLTVGTGALPAGVLAQAGSARFTTSFSEFKNVLGADAKSALDAVAVSNLAPGNSFGVLINRTSDNPNGAGSATPFLDNNGSANNSTIRMTAANVRALYGDAVVNNANVKLASCTVNCDAFIQFSTGFVWDHDRSNGIAANAFDFVGIAAHEIGHALGFVSGVDTLDANSNGNISSNAFTYVSPLDLFRWSAQSAQLGAIDFTADNRNKYFSIDRGAHMGPQFSTGVTRGDGRQASHWKDNLGIGAMDPTAGFGELLNLDFNEFNAMDAIGWDVPEPGSIALVGASLALLAARRRRR